MSDEGATAREVHELLLSAHPELRDVSLAKAAQLAHAQFESSKSNETVSSFHDFQSDTSAAIQRLRTAIAAGITADEGEQLLLKAISVAEKWVTACE
jgi:3-dehydroquinate dehydratase